MLENSTMALTPGSIVYITVEVVIGLCSIVGNVLVIWVVKLNPSLQNTTFYFIVSLAVADIAVGVLVMPLAIVVSLGLTIHFYNCLFMTCLLLVFTHASIMSLLAIAVDRYLRVKLTIRYKRVTTQRRIWMALGFCWLVSILVGLVPMFGWNQRLNPECSGNSSFLPCLFRSVMRMDYMVYFSFFTWILIPLVIMCAIYVDIFYVIRNKLRQNFSGSKETGAFYGREFKTAKSLFLILFLFAISWLPLSIINCVSYFFPKAEIPPLLLSLGILLSHANSMMNPIVYACKIKKFKETYLLILKSYILHIRLLFYLSFQRLASWAMHLFLMLLGALFTDAIVMDRKFKEAFVQDTASATCSYDPYYKDYPKYWCKGYYRNFCNVIASTPNSTSRVSLKDTGMQLIITLTCLTKEDTGWYWCGIQRDHASDYMDYTELIVFDGVKDTTGSQRKENRTCKESGIGYSESHNRRTCHQPMLPLRLSILSICMLVMGIGVITVAVILLRRKRNQKHVRIDDTVKPFLGQRMMQEKAHRNRLA
ncbi:adenosine receptor A3 [Gracilinanus agilis]|uniref:adenosine receptor A3 n=1 Tax=Gracilinanus agilis TaxID=191870 RepID=UPI001CFD7C98|nr:adenosine receptor A3 [Gracilinanus agilis]